VKELPKSVNSCHGCRKKIKVARVCGPQCSSRRVVLIYPEDCNWAVSISLCHSLIAPLPQCWWIAVLQHLCYHFLPVLILVLLHPIQGVERELSTVYAVEDVTMNEWYSRVFVKCLLSVTCDTGGSTHGKTGRSGVTKNSGAPWQNVEVVPLLSFSHPSLPFLPSFPLPSNSLPSFPHIFPFPSCPLPIRVLPSLRSRTP